MPRCAKKILSTGKILAGLGIIENAHDRPAEILGLGPDQFLSEEPGLLERARTAMPTLPVDELDPLIVDVMGKDISGVGLADVITRQLFDKIDFQQMNANASTSTFLERAKIPIVADNDRQVIDFALRSMGPLAPGQERVMRIRDTLSLQQLYVSPAVLEGTEHLRHIEKTAESIPLLDERGAFPDGNIWS
jgi:hypothetical protein